MNILLKITLPIAFVVALAIAYNMGTVGGYDGGVEKGLRIATSTISYSTEIISIIKEKEECAKWGGEFNLYSSKVVAPGEDVITGGKYVITGGKYEIGEISCTKTTDKTLFDHKF